MGETILIVDDEPDILELVRFNLVQEGFVVQTAVSGREGLERVRQNSPDLLILDLMLPDVAGTEVCRQIRRDPELSELPIIMLTAKSEEVDRIVGLELGADDYVTKPFSMRELQARVKALFRRVEAFEAALRSDACGRALAAGIEVEELRRRIADLQRELAALEVAALPRRVVHHDCKLNNLLFDRVSGEALCVIDLDTVMEGNLLSDFGELVRTASCRAAEDERDLARVQFDLALFEALARGYLAGFGRLLTEHERRALPVAGRLFSLMNAARFLTDHLTGDVYFRIRREGHNLDRARAQLRLAERMLEHAGRAQEIVERA